MKMYGVIVFDLNQYAKESVSSSVIVLALAFLLYEPIPDNIKEPWKTRLLLAILQAQWICGLWYTCCLCLLKK